MTTNTQSFLTEHATSHLMDYQIQKINRQIQDFIHVNQGYAILVREEFSCLEFIMNRDTINWILK